MSRKSPKRFRVVLRRKGRALFQFSFGPFTSRAAKEAAESLRSAHPNRIVAIEPEGS